MNQKSLESSLQESRLFPPPGDFAARAVIDAAELQRLHDEAARDPTGFWAAQARAELDWHKPFTTTLDDSAAPNYRWFADGKLNVSYNCLDVNLAAHRDHTALVFEPESGPPRRLTYGELHVRSEEHTSELQSRENLVCRLLLEKKK